MEIPGPAKNVKKMTRLELYDILKEFKGKKMDENFSLLEDRLVELTSCPTEKKNVLTRSLRCFKTSFKQKWMAAHHTDERFLQNNAEWLKSSLELPVWSQKPGRPVKQFQELSDRSKRRRTKELRAQVPAEELTYAARVSQSTSENTDTAVIIKEITSTPTRAKNPECSSEITGINIDIIKRFKVILKVISSGHVVGHIKFDLYAQTTGKLYVELYGWHPMSPTVHKVLMHGAQIIAEAIVPIGQLSEEAAEARNKHFRKYRVDFTRKFSRVSCNREILNRLLLTSDPYISCNRIKRKKARTPFSNEALNMFLASTPHPDGSDDEDHTILSEIASEREICDSD